MCLQRGSGFGSPHPHRRLQTPVTLVLGNPTSSSGLLGHQAHTWYTRLVLSKMLIQCFVLFELFGG